MDLESILQGLSLEMPQIPQSYWIFLGALLVSLLVGQWSPAIVGLIIRRAAPQQGTQLNQNLIEPVRGLLRLTGTLILVSLSMVWIQETKLYAFLNPFLDLAMIASVAWLTSRLFRQVFRIYGVDLLKRMGREVDELLLVFETLANVVIGFIAVLAFAQSQSFNLVGLFASLGIGGLAIAFAAQKILEQLLSTVVLYLDRPFIPGEYIRLSDGQLGRIESTGLRSTKIRTAAKSTLFIVPNSTLISMDIENVSRAKKVMVMLYLDFARRLLEEDAALVRQVVRQSTESVFGIDPGSTQIAFLPSSSQEGDRGEGWKRARVTFFILGSNENSIELRKRLLELANENIAKKLDSYGIQFTTQDPTAYVESPVTL